jgi:AcrR family transcriptional regulator
MLESRGKTMSERGSAPMREQILDVARELILIQGYAGTSIADIAARVNTSKAAIYYHFSAKSEILSALLGEHVADFRRLTDAADDGLLTPAGVLAGYIDRLAASGAVFTEMCNDPSVQQELARHDVPGMEAKLVAVLAGPQAPVAAKVRAYAALGAVQSLAGIMAEEGGAHQDGTLSEEARAELLAAALRALGEG